MKQAALIASIAVASLVVGGLAATVAIARAPVEEVETSDYFVQFGGGLEMDVWVSKDIAEDFEDARLDGKDFAHDVHIIPDTPEAEAFIKTLPTQMRDVVRSLEGAIYLRWRDRIYLVTGGC